MLGKSITRSDLGGALFSAQVNISLLGDVEHLGKVAACSVIAPGNALPQTEDCSTGRKAGLPGVYWKRCGRQLADLYDWTDTHLASHYCA